ncbi:glycoside hydrolase family 2 protein [Chitinophaga lutea]|uniref:Beta-mannosidase B n=1 Tax=Chitinophaga lutea TaxID=2488634 RepID=A0A3N4PW04_9BACT|nr:glycoside hydrolase family 2 protein [Chitinophaga lutea]RPE12832.1 glycoside hydrolase family 2 protein [Chitinophaga lutea]
MRNLLKSLLLAALATPAFAQTNSELKGNWEFRRTDENIWRTATVPGTVHTDLLAHRLIPDPFQGANEKGLQWIDKKDWEYRCSFDVTGAQLQHDALSLDFTGLDTYADVYLNDALILKAVNMFAGKEVAVKPLLKAGKNQLRILFHSPVAYDMPKFLESRLVYPAGNDASDIPLSIFARKAPYHYGWDWGPRYVTSGIWRPVYLKAWNKVQLADSWLRQESLNSEQANLNAALTLNVQEAGTYRLLVVHEKGTAAINHTLTAGTQTVNIPFTIRKPELWWPNGLGAQRLYNVTVAVMQGKDTLQKQEQRIGLRTVTVKNEKDAQGTSFTVMVNGHPVFMKGTNYIPSDNFLPRVTPERYRKMFADMQESNFNMVRVWGGGIYENDQFYDLADEKGILVWQDFMFACTLYPSDTAFLRQVKEEAAYNIRRLRNHASLALWCGNNEVAVAIKNWGWKDGYAYSDAQWASMLKGYETLFGELLRDEVKTHDPGRFYFPSSPISNWGRKEDFSHGDNHYWGVWHGMEWFEAFATHVPRFMSEYGFQSFPDIHTVRRYADSSQWDIHSFVMQAHQKSFTRGNAAIKTYMDHYHHQPKDFPAFLYLSQVLQAEGMKTGMEAHRRAMPFCMGSLYWQFNDCWPGASWSGIDYFGRWKAMQYFVKKAYNPLLVSTVQDGGSVSTYIVNDHLRNESLLLDMQLTDLDGRVLWEKQTPVTAKANTSAVQHSIRRDALLKGADSTRVILYTKLLKNNKVLSDNVFYFAASRQMPLPATEVGVTVEDNKGAVTLKLKSSQLARNVYLLLDGDADSHFSDNYFDLLPGRETTVTVQTKLTAEEVKKQLQVQHLALAYKVEKQ